MTQIAPTPTEPYQLTTMVSFDYVGEFENFDITVNDNHEFYAGRVNVKNCMGKYHPHGDVAIYDSMVTLSSGDGLPFALIDGQGNWGNFDGSPAAAPRYTECRLMRFAVDSLVPKAYMDKDVIPYIDNYDGSEREPLYLPSLLPTLFLLGADGIATGVSVSMPSYSYESVLVATKLLFKTGSGRKAARKLVPVQRWGAVLTSEQNALDSYHKTGQGSLTWVAPFTVKRDKGDGSVVTLTGLPPTTEIGWDKLSANLQNMKGVYSVIDVSDADGITIEIKVKDEATLPAVKKALARTQSLRSSATILVDKESEDSPLMVEFRPWAPIQILEEWKKWRVDLEKRLIKSLIRDNDAEMKRLNLLILAASHLDIIFAILKAKSGDKVAMIAKQLKVNLEDAKTIWALAVGRLDKLNLDDTREQVAKLEATNRRLKKEYKEPEVRILTAIALLPKTDPNAKHLKKAA